MVVAAHNLFAPLYCVKLLGIDACLQLAAGSGVPVKVEAPVTGLVVGRAGFLIYPRSTPELEQGISGLSNNRQRFAINGKPVRTDCRQNSSVGTAIPSKSAPCKGFTGSMPMRDMYW